MTPAPPPHRPPNRPDDPLVAIVLLCVLAAAGLSWQWARRPLRFPDAPPVMPARARAAAERINPNTDPPASLVRLPNVGPARAQAIVAYRVAHGPAAFATPADLARVHGIGPTTVRRATPLLELGPAPAGPCAPAPPADPMEPTTP
jgi:DNA uptake protein ComE-like DNA-binding protein